MAAGDGHEFFHILGVFLGDDVYGVIVGDDAYQCFAAVEHRQGEQVVLLDFAGRVLLVVFHVGVNDLPMHEVADPVIAPGHDEVLEGHKPEQFAVFVHHVGVIDRLLVRCDFTETIDSLGSGQLRREGGVSPRS